MFGDLKYITAYTLPVTAALGLYMGGIWSYSTPVVGFVLIPILEIMLPLDRSNINDEERNRRKANRIFDLMLYLNVFWVYGILYFTLDQAVHGDRKMFEIIGMVISAGMVMGSNGINVGHELGHREPLAERLLAKLLLLPSLYMHFFIEHNWGHHLRAATPEDPATARYQQSVYAFWFTSVTGQYRNAWKIQHDLLKRQGLGFFSLKNDMFWYVILELGYLGLVYTGFGGSGLLLALASAVTAFLLLETINYIEHYGLLRTKVESGRYERVREIHSWNSNHVMGRIMLYELTRHSDHHYRASKAYQLLDYHEISPQLPYGYPTSMVLSLCPPLWFRIMNPRIPGHMVKQSATDLR